MEEIRNLSENELLELRRKVDSRLKSIKRQEKINLARKNSVRNKTKLSQLTSADHIFGIQLKPDGSVYTMGYHEIGEISKYNGSPGWYNITLGGISSGMDEHESNKHYYLFVHCSSNYFFTLKPETWEKDIKEALKYELKREKLSHQKEYESLSKKIDSYFNNVDEINNRISELCK